MNITSILAISPEIILTLSTVIILISGLYSSISKASWWLGCFAVALTIVFMIGNHAYIDTNNISVLGGIANDPMSLMLKFVVLSFAFLILIFYGGMVRVIPQKEAIIQQSSMKSWAHESHEFVVIILLATIGAMITISARNFLILYVALELIALASYILASYDRDNLLSTEAGMKYFVLGSLASCIMIFGMSFIYGFSGSLSFYKLHNLLADGLYSSGLISGIAIFLIGILFKLSIAPFHFWTPDIYQGSPIISVAFFASIPKFAVLCALINIINLSISDISHLWSKFFIALSIMSMIIGAFGAIIQKSFKRLMGYSTVLNMGFVLLALATASKDGYVAALIYQILYAVSSIGIFAILAITTPQDAQDYEISSLAGFGLIKKLAAFAMSIFMFSLVGIPPMAGFFAKFYVIRNAVANHLYVAAIVALIISVASAFYYINIVKVMYFTQPSEKQIRLNESSSLGFVISICVAITMLLPVIQNIF